MTGNLMADDAKKDADLNKDYTGQGSGEEEVTFIENPEQLASYLKKSGAVNAPKEGAEGNPPTTKKEEKKPAGPAPKLGDPNYKIPATLETEEEETEEKDDDDNEEFPNMIVYLDKEFDLGLNLKEIPKDMTREQEAEAVAGVFRRIDDGVRAKLSEYEGINQLLKDKEVDMFLKAKREGKTLKDIAAMYNSAPASAPDDVVVSRQMKAMYPTLTEADIQTQVTSLREKGLLEKTASAARDFFKAEDEKTAAATEAAKQKEAEEAEEQYQESVQDFARFLHGTSQVHGVPITPEMKKKVFTAVTHRDAQGMTEHDRLLQSEAGTFLSALGMYHLQDLLKNRLSEKANKGKKSFVDKLLDQPSQLQSGSEAQSEPDFNPTLANQF